MHIRWHALALLALVAIHGAWCSSPSSPQEIAPGVYAALQPFADRFNDSNSTIIVLDDSLVVVDTQTTLTATRSVIDQIRKLTNKPVRWVINTHWHGDHVQGNQVYRELFPQVQFIAQTHTREDMQTRATAELKDDVDGIPQRVEGYRKMLAAGTAPDGQPLTSSQKDLFAMRIAVFTQELPDLQQTHIVLPDVTFEDSLTLHGSHRDIRIIHYQGHTRGDAVVFLPAEKILISGDLLDDMPFTGHGSPAELVKTLHQLDQLDFETVIPGHGGIEHGHGHLRQVAALFESIVDQVHKAVQNGLSLDDTKKQVKIEEFRAALTNNEEHANRAFDGFGAAAIERAYADEKGGAPQ